MQLKIGYLFQCPPWARGFCPFRACGAKLANSELPLKISLINNRFWQIEGSLPPNMTGGTAIIVIKKDDGQIQYIRHTK